MPPSLFQTQLLKVGQSVVRLVRAAQRYGPVVIVTDSHERWVRGTAALLLPGGSAAACLENVEIVSTRERFGGDFPDQPSCWQIAAFSYVTNRHLLSADAVARVKRSGTAAAATAATKSGGGDGGGATVAAKGSGEGSAHDASSGGGAEAPAAEGGSGGGSGVGGHRRRRRRRHRRGGSGGSSSGSSIGDGAALAVGGVGTLIAVATSSRAAEDKSAAQTLREHHPNIVAKTVALMEKPTPLELKKQLDLLADKFELMLGHTSPPQTPSTASPSPSSSTSVSPPVLEGDGGAEGGGGGGSLSRLGCGTSVVVRLLRAPHPRRPSPQRRSPLPRPRSRPPPPLPRLPPLSPPKTSRITQIFTA